jgi:hypothetical protein
MEYAADQYGHHRDQIHQKSIYQVHFANNGNRVQHSMRGVLPTVIDNFVTRLFAEKIRKRLFLGFFVMDDHSGIKLINFGITIRVTKRYIPPSRSIAGS